MASHATPPASSHYPPALSSIGRPRSKLVERPPPSPHPSNPRQLTPEQHLGTDGTTVLSTVTNAYDHFRRLSSVTDSTGITHYGYFQDGTQSYVLQPGHVRADTVTALNLSTNDAVKQTRADTLSVTTAENSYGQVASQSGVGVLAASFNYDPYTTDLNGFSLNSLFNSTSASTADTRTWSFDQHTGLPSSDSINSYTYWPDGRIQTATRGSAWQTTYTPDYNNAGEVVGEDYKWSVSAQDELGDAATIVDTEDGRAFATSTSYTRRE